MTDALSNARFAIIRTVSSLDTHRPPSSAMPTSEHYRKSAEDCRRNAKEAHDVHERETLLRMAAQWDRLAEHKARKESEQE
jgi:hypothetical protein